MNYIEREVQLAELQAKIISLDEAIRTREDFLSIAAHELKTPVAAAKLKFQIGLKILNAQTPLSADKLMQLFKDGDRQMDRLTSLIDNLLDFSRVQSGRLVLHREKSNLAALTREIFTRFSEQLSFAGCAVTITTPDELTGSWDRDRLDQVITNLIVNVIRYAPGNPVRVELKRVGENAHLIVQDQGMGISQEGQLRIFDRYERGVPFSNGHGMGLGLYISREIVRAHGGSIHVESQLGQGARFVVALPIMEERLTR